MYEVMRQYGIPSPEYMAIDHLSPRVRTLEEHVDYIVYDGRKMKKPFVEKPIDGDDHNIWIYYPSAAGGGCKKLFRKIGDKSSAFEPGQSRIRRDGHYLYEPFLPTQGMDVKV